MLTPSELLAVHDYENQRALVANASAKLALHKLMPVAIPKVSVDVLISDDPDTEHIATGTIVKVTDASETNQTKQLMTFQEQLIHDHVQLVHRMLFTVPVARAERDLAFSDGMIGLWQAAQRYDPSFGIPFASYASTRIRGAIIDGQRDFYGLNRKTGERQNLLSASKTISIDTPLYVDSAITVADTLMDTALTAEMMIEHTDSQQEEKERLASLVDQLSNREKEVIQLYYSGKKFHEIATMIGVTESRISQIHKKAISNLKSLVQPKSIELPVAYEPLISPYVLAEFISNLDVSYTKSDIIQHAAGYYLTSDINITEALQTLTNNGLCMQNDDTLTIDEQFILRKQGLGLNHLIELDQTSLGFSVKSSALHRRLPEQIVRSQRVTASQKIGAKNAAHAVRIAIEQNLIFVSSSNSHDSLPVDQLRSLYLVAEGQTSLIIARQTDSSLAAIKDQRIQVVKKLKAHNIAHAVRLAYERGDFSVNTALA